MKKKKKLYYFLALLCFVFWLIGCAKVATEKEIILYAKEEYGEAELLSTEKVSEEECICTFKDKEFGFTYYVKSKVEDVGLDGSKFWESESKSSDFEETYYDIILRKAMEMVSDQILWNEVNTEYSDNQKAEHKYFEPEFQTRYLYGRSPYLLDITMLSETSDALAKAKQFAKDFLKAFRTFDKRGFFEDGICIIYDKNGQKILTFNYLHSETGINPEEQAEEEFTNLAVNLNKKSEYLRKEEKVFKDTGISLDELVLILGNEEITMESTVTYYYFEAEGKEFFIADFMVRDEETGSFERFSNYKKVFEKMK